jgi:branched-chain amino acid transport system ATP-binding protein
VIEPQEEKVLLQVANVTKNFAALTAVNGVSLGIHEGELVALIGPNGAGKTTFFNLLCGFLKPDSGNISFAGQDMTRLAPHEISHRGIGLAFQLTNIFGSMTVLQNVQVALFSAHRKNSKLFVRATDFLFKDAKEILESIGLDGSAGRTAEELSQADKKRLELGIALAVRPKLLLLDEPTSGQSREETALTTSLIKRINQEQNLTILFIEHKMDVVFGIAKRVVVMQYGSVIADGLPEVVRQDKKVQQAYLGEVTEYDFRD